MKRIKLGGLKCAWILVLLLFIQCKVSGQKDEVKPNIIIFYADDLGWQDTQLNDLDAPTPWETPNLLKLAKEGINFTNAYSPAPTCAPSRCALLSGLHPAKTGITHVSGGDVPSARYTNYVAPYYPIGLMPENFTIAESLKKNGYITGHVGKWHAGGLKIQSPSNQGFDFVHESRGAHQGPKNPGNRLTEFATYAKNDKYRLSDEKYPPFTTESPNGISYPKDDVTENALKFIRQSKEEPFFLYLAHWLVHAPIHTKNKELLQYYSDKLGVDFPTKDIPVTTEGQTNPYYGAMVTTLDWSLGRIVDLLKKTDDPRNPGKKLYETTYIFFSSDNGGVERANRDIVTDNAPLDEGKKYAQEGGIRVPMVIAGPNLPKGKTFDYLINQLDFYPTILNLTQSKIATEYSSDLDGLDISGVLLNNEKNIKGKNGKAREDLWWHFPHNQDHQMQSAIRAGDFKLYKNHLKGNYELYQLYNNGKRVDLEEKFDIASKSPEVVKALSEKLEKYLKDYDAKLPYKDPLKTKDASEKQNIASIPIVEIDSFDSKTNKLSVTLVNGKTDVTESYALIKIGDPPSFDKNGTKRKLGKHGTTYIKVPVESSENGLAYTVSVPKEALECGIILIDKNKFIVKSKFHKIN
ncbi:sulfatase [Cellulophaga sp. F20128]|uniref:sulfatase n=1 Tax=Cellulophaga sp. F20128 TaxID=2926413 RepID=UPI001FF6E84E|nr:sulfatase [Cellulophaga sp. F20128]MCK0157300.1 sulfatase [Cellulophaga sp. F20128]